MAVILETSLGQITLDLYTDERPKCCLNFLKLCKIKYYNFCIFHSVQKNLVAQTGDPTFTGRGGESIYGKLYGDQAKYFEQETKPRIKHAKLGTLSMVNNGENMHGSQFFLTTSEGLSYLDGLHTVFGEVAEGFDVLTKINESFCDEDHRPFRDIRIYHTVVVDDPYDDPPTLRELIPERSPTPTREQLDTGRIAADEELDDKKGKTMEEIEEEMAAREAGANAQLLEMVGDIPDAEVAPEDNVLFVCKLNQVTTSEDLEIIFSRFGPITSCEVIKDHKSGESLQYAFVEFEKVKDCENAYFKMDNVLIDDRRIHVDFSQSVSKLKYKGKKGDSNSRYITSKSEDPDRPTYALASKKRNDGYDFVYDVNEENDAKKKDDNRKKKDRQRDKRPRSRERNRRSRSRERRRSRSHERYRRSRSRDHRRASPDERQRSSFRKSRTGDITSRQDRERSRSRDRHARHRSRRQRSRDRRDRSFSREIS